MNEKFLTPTLTSIGSDSYKSTLPDKEWSVAELISNFRRELSVYEIELGAYFGEQITQAANHMERLQRENQRLWAENLEYVRQEALRNFV